MNNFQKVSSCLLALAAVTMSYGQIRVKQSATAVQRAVAPTRVQPIAIQKVRFIDRTHYIPLGPVVPYQDFLTANRVGNLLYDAYEGAVQGDGSDIPTDGLYGETFLPESPGNRWTLGDDYVETYSAYHMDKIAGTPGTPAQGIDFLMKNNATGDTVTAIGFFTSDDPLDPNAPVAPSTFNDGIILSYSGISAGSFIYSNVDLTTSGITLTMPSTSQGWYSMIIASANNNGTLTQASSAQPGRWGTKVYNPSQTNNLAFQDGDGTAGTQDGTLNTLFDWTFSYRGTASAYTITKGVETSTHDVTRLQGTAGQSVIVNQRFQFVASLPNAEVTATVTLDPATPTTSLHLLRAVVKAKANALPFQDPSCVMTTSLFNRATGTWTVVDQRKPTNASGDGAFFKAPSIPVADIPNYINTADNTVQVRLGVRQLKPVILGWNLTVNQLSVDVGQVGPDPLTPAVAFSSN